jgi:AcrR family transcriptional regulator
MLRSEQVEATRRAVLAAARSSFGRKGYAQTSVDGIATAARVTKGAVYHHFADKEALFRAVHAEVEAKALARMAQAGDPEGPPIDQIVDRVKAYLDVAALDEEVRRITLIDGPAVLGLEPDGPADQHAAHKGLRSFIATAIADGLVVDLDPDVLAHLIGGLALLGGLLIARAGEPDVTREALAQAIDAMLRALAPNERR